MTDKKRFPFEWTQRGQKDFLSTRTPMLATFELVVHQISWAMAATHDEESITSAFLGSLLATYPWCALYGVLPESVDSCSWSTYSKSGHDFMSESSSGADFALVLRRSDVVSVALFQAKKALLKTNDVRAVNIFRRKLEKEIREVEVGEGSRKRWTLTGSVSVQIDHLIQTATLLEGACLKTSNRVAPKNSWVHYLGYYPGGVKGLHLHMIPEEKINAARVGTETECDVELTSDNSEDWVTILKSGLEGVRSPHWLPMSLDAAKAHLPKLLPLMSLVILDESNGDGALRFEIEGVDFQEMVVNRRGGRLRKILSMQSVVENLHRRRAGEAQATEAKEKKVKIPSPRKKRTGEED